MDNNELLEQYKKYDNLGKNIKILVNYIKPSFLFKSEILTPIHLGRAVEQQISKDGKITETDLDWLHKNCISDDFESGISKYNRRVGFLTGTYWAWKNYEQLGNPQYFGSFGYRRLLNPEFLPHIADCKPSVILPKRKDFKIETIKDQFINYHGQELYEMALKFAPKGFEQYCEGTSGYFDEIYVMRKDIFFDFCEWIFPLLFKYLTLSQIVLNGNDYRDIGFITERLTGYYLSCLVQKLKFMEVELVATEKFKVNPNVIDKNMLAKLRLRLK